MPKNFTQLRPVMLIHQIFICCQKDIEFLMDDALPTAKKINSCSYTREYDCQKLQLSNISALLE